MGLSSGSDFLIVKRMLFTGRAVKGLKKESADIAMLENDPGKKPAQNRSDMLANEKIGRLLFKLSLPAIIGMMVNALYNMVDTIFVGRWVGTLAIGALAVAFPLQMLVHTTGQTIGAGGASIISRRMGAGNKEEAGLTLGNMLLMALIIGVAFLALGMIAIVPLLKLFGTTDAMMPYAIDYFQVFLLACPFLIMNMTCANAIIAEGNSKMAMLTMAMGAVLNIILDPIFIYVLEMGVRGAAIATTISIAATCLFLLSYFIRGKSEIPVGWRFMRIKFKMAGRILAIGSPSFAREGAMSVTIGLLNNALRIYGGDVAIATFGVIFRVFAFIFMPLMGLTIGLQPIVGFNYGARQFRRVKQSIQLASAVSTAASTFGFLILVLFPELIMRIFSNDPELIALGRNALRFTAIAVPLTGVQVIGGGVFQALGKPVQALLLSLSRQVLVLIPLVLIMPRLFGLNGVWLSFPVADTLSFLITLAFLITAVKHLPRETG